MFKVSHYLPRAVVLMTSLALVSTVGCTRDPNVRKQRYLESGKRYEADGKYKEAAIQFSNALKLDKSFAPAHFELAKTYLKLQSFVPAYQELTQTVELEPSNQEARITFGNLLLGGRAYDRATEQAKAVLALNPNSADAYALLAGLAERQGDPATAMTDIQKAISLDPNRATFHSALAVLESNTPATSPDAEAELRKAASLDAKSAIPHLLLAAMLARKGDTQGAEQEFSAAVTVEPTNLSAREALATMYLRSGDKAKAEQTLTQMIDQMPDNEAASTMLVDFYTGTGQLDRAESVFADLYAKHPKSFGIKLTYARVLFERKEYDKLTPLLTQLTKTDAGNPRVASLNAMLLGTQGKLDDANTMLLKAANDNPTDLQTHLILAKVQMARGNIADAQKTYEQVDKLNPGNMEAANSLAQIAVQRNDANTLTQIADKVILAHPDYLLAYLWRGMAESSRKEYDKAEPDFQLIIKRDPNASTAYLELAQIRIVQGKTAEAKTLIQTALDKDPNSYRALGLLASFDMQAKQPAKAIDLIQAQIAKEPNNYEFYVGLAAIQLQTKDFNAALAAAQKAMQLAPASPDVIQVYSQAEVALGNLDAAISAWQTWSTAHPRDAHSNDLLGSLEEAKGDQQKAMEYYKKSLQIDANDPVSANDLAYLMVETNQNADVALTLAQTARRGLPNNAETADTLAWVYYYKGDYGAARDLLESASKASPENVSLQLHLGMTYAKLNNKADAILHLKKAASIDPKAKAGVEANAELAKLGAA